MELRYRELVLMDIFRQYYQATGTTPTQPMIVDFHRPGQPGLFMDWLHQHGVNEWICIPMRGSNQLTQSIRQLRMAGFVEPDKLRLTVRGEDFLKQMGEWTRWPQAIHVEEGIPDWDTAKILPA